VYLRHQSVTVPDVERGPDPDDWFGDQDPEERRLPDAPPDEIVARADDWLDETVRRRQPRQSWAQTIDKRMVTVAASLIALLIAGLAASRLMALTDDHLVELTISLVLAYGSYLAADAVHQSGIIATVVAAVVLGNRAPGRSLTPIGEDALDQCLVQRFDSAFLHHEHSLRVVDILERDGQGLNLTLPVRDGIVGHSGRAQEPSTLEGKIVRLVDRIAYINHDIDDALRAGVLRLDDLPEAPIRLLGATGSRRIDALVHDLVESSAVAGDIVQSTHMGEAMLELRSFLFARVYEQGPLRAETERAAMVVRMLFEHYCTAFAEEGLAGDALATAVVDEIAGMTDRFAVRRYRELYEPKAWSVL